MKYRDKINVEYVDVNKLRYYPNNPRYWSEKQIENLTKSLKKYTLLQPLVVNTTKGRENIVLSGNFRLFIAKKLGYKTVPIIKVNITNPETEQELVLRFNANVGSWSYDILKDFKLDVILEAGFDETELNNIFDNNLSVEDDEFDEKTELKKSAKSTIKKGDLFALGPHKIYCADSHDPETVKKLTGKRIVTLMINDPIYNIGLDYDKGIGGKSSYGGTVKDRKTDAEYKEFLKKGLVNGLSICKKDAHIFCFSDESYIWLIQSLYKELGITNRRVCLWIKNNFNCTPQVAFSKGYEPCTYGTIGNPYISPLIKNLGEILNKEIGTGNRAIEDIIELFNLWLVKRLPTTQYLHPTSKPPSLYEKVLKRCTKAGDYVLDLYAGSSPLLIATEQLNRKALLVEIDPQFVDLSIRRYEKLTNIKARKLN